MNKREIGSIYEEKAVHFLESHGYYIIDRNFRCKIGEIDIIAKKDEYLCFIEVKFRSSTKNGYPAEAISIYKRRKIYRTAQFYIIRHGLPEDIPYRFDVILILDKEISLLENAFEGIL